MISAFSGVAIHLWQSTLFALGIAVLALLLRDNRARIRYLLWLSASVKFLVPFAWLTVLGTLIPLPSYTLSAALQGLLTVAGPHTLNVSRLAANPAGIVPTSVLPLQSNHWLYVALAAVWFTGTVLIATRRLHQWLQIRHTLRDSTSADFEFVIPARVIPSQMEPAVFGVLRPVLLLPAGLTSCLKPAEMRSVLAHEACHVASRDNLSAMLHTMVEAVFWFHPFVWWIGKRLVDERERACDEQVLAEGHAPLCYSEAILKVCEHYLQNPLTCAAGIGGAHLPRRINAIMNQRTIADLGRIRRLLLALTVTATLGVPLAAGAVAGADTRPQPVNDVNVPALRNISITVTDPSQAQRVPTKGLFVLALAGGSRVESYYSLRDVIADAYGVSAPQVVGKDLSREPLYHVIADNPWQEGLFARGAERAAVQKKLVEQYPAMVRNLLSTRFGLVTKRERRQMNGYVLTTSAGGSKLTPDPDAPSWRQGTGQSDHEIFATGAPLGVVLKLIQQSVASMPVLDQTGLGGNYDYKLTWKNSGPDARPAPEALAAALEEQLGLHLEPRRVTVDVINVIGLKTPAQIVTQQ